MGVRLVVVRGCNNIALDGVFEVHFGGKNKTASLNEIYTEIKIYIYAGANKK